MTTPTGGGGDGQGPVNIPLPGMPPLPGESEDQSGVTLPTHTRSGADLPTLDGHTPAFRDQIYRFLTGQSTASTSENASIREQMVAAFGTSQRDATRPDTAEVAKRMGVSRRTVQRWIRNNGGLNPDHRKSLQRRARQAASTKRGRAQALRRADRAGTNQRRGTGIHVGGIQGVKSSLEDNYRDRSTHTIVTDADLADLRQAWTDHGDTGADAWLHSHFDKHYTDHWHFADIDDVDWGDSHNY